jgi:hypothetical protein
LKTEHVRTFEKTYASLGRRLTSRDAMPLSRIRAAEKRLGCLVPKALRDYCSVAGNETDFNTIFNRLLPPDEWFIDHQRLVFMEENQAVVLWGVPAMSRESDDPAVYQGVNDSEIKWFKEHQRCSVFLKVMLHWHGAFGGALPITSTAFASVALRKKLKREWKFVGEVNHMQAFAKAGKTVCHLKWDDGWRVFAGAVSKTKLEEIAHELPLTWLT